MIQYLHYMYSYQKTALSATHINHQPLCSMIPKKILRLLFISLGAYIFFSTVLLPLRIDGLSMEPTFKDGGFTFCWRQKYLFSTPARGDVVAIRFAGRKVVLLKRIVALEGETVSFREGLLFVNGKPIEEPYVQHRLPWDLPPRRVRPNKVYVVGDNRGVPMDNHYFGQVAVNRIIGGVPW